MVTIGDVFSVVSILFGVCLSTWALLLGSTLLFRQRTQTAQETIDRHPWKSFFFGLVILAFAGTISVAMVANPVPGIKLLGTMGVLALLSVAAIGAGGLAQLVGDRIRPMDPTLTPFRAVGRGAMILVVAGLLPLVGWWVFAPIVLAVSLGAGLFALVARPEGTMAEAA